jgi:gamma-glutamylaminecyclotransferase
MKQRVFVYGTLRHEQYFHDKYLGDGKSIYRGIARTTKDFQLYVDGQPHMVREPGDTGVIGELYDVSNEVLKTLDDLEAHPVVYYRDIIEVLDETGNKILAWAYLRPIHFKGKSTSHKEEEFV